MGTGVLIKSGRNEKIGESVRWKGHCASNNKKSLLYSMTINHSIVLVPK